MAKDSIHSIYSYYKYLGLGTYKERKRIIWLTFLYLAESREHVALIRHPWVYYLMLDDTTIAGT